MKFPPALHAAALALLARLDQVPPARLLIVVPLLVLVCGAGLVAAAALLAAGFVIATSAGLAVLARSAIQAATPTAPAHLTP